MTRVRLHTLLWLCIFFLGLHSIQAQEKDPDKDSTVKPEQHSEMADMPGMHHGDGKAMTADSFFDEIMQHGTSGTSSEPDSTPIPMLMFTPGKWQLMLHGSGFISTLQQSGPRGGDKVFGAGWLMSMAQRPLPKGQLTLRLMLSPEPATVTGRFYPELFQQGETAFGKPISDGQHPHDFFMEVAALYDLKLGQNALLTLYAAPIGDPSIGPSAFAHRTSASENPLATLGHHLQDSTHIVSNVITAGLAYKQVRLEASGFHGREPNEDRWDIDTGKLDSWSTRLTVQPSKNWSTQYSFARLISPEAQNPLENIDRMTASVMYNRPLLNGNWASTVLWGRNRVRSTGEVFNGYLLESTLNLAKRNNIWTRIENTDRTSDLLLHGQVQSVGLQEVFLARVQAYTLGYDREIGKLGWISSTVALGGEATFYQKPSFLDGIYGQHPASALVFLRLRLVDRTRGVASSRHAHHGTTGSP